MNEELELLMEADRCEECGANFLANVLRHNVQVGRYEFGRAWLHAIARLGRERLESIASNPEKSWNQ